LISETRCSGKQAKNRYICVIFFFDLTNSFLRTGMMLHTSRIRNRIMLVDRYNNRRDLPRCNVARANKRKPEITCWSVTSIFRWSRPLRVELSSFSLLLRTAMMMAHVHTHEPHAHTYIWSAIRKEHLEWIPLLFSSVTTITFNFYIMITMILWSVNLNF